MSMFKSDSQRRAVMAAIYAKDHGNQGGSPGMLGRAKMKFQAYKQKRIDKRMAYRQAHPGTAGINDAAQLGARQQFSSMAAGAAIGGVLNAASGAIQGSRYGVGALAGARMLAPRGALIGGAAGLAFGLGKSLKHVYGSAMEKQAGKEFKTTAARRRYVTGARYGASGLAYNTARYGRYKNQ